MTHDEFISAMKLRGTKFAPPSTPNQIGLTNAALQQRKCAMLPKFMMDLYSACGGAHLGSGYIFGPTEVPNGLRFPIPSILKVNDEIATNNKMIGKTVFGRNDLFWFAFDAFGTCYMLDNTNLNPLRKYDDPYRALADCLIAGKL